MLYNQLGQPGQPQTSDAEPTHNPPIQASHPARQPNKPGTQASQSQPATSQKGQPDSNPPATKVRFRDPVRNVSARQNRPWCLSARVRFFSFFLATTWEAQKYESSEPWGATGPRGKEKGHGEEILRERISKIHPKIFRCQHAPSQNSVELFPQRISKGNRNPSEIGSLKPSKFYPVWR